MTDTEISGNERQQAQVLGYRSQGWWIIDTAIRTKVPNTHAVAWQNQRLETEELKEHFQQPQNTSLLLGVDQNSPILVDVDFDRPEAVAAARGQMPPTETLFGRSGRGVGHYLYELSSVPKPMSWRIGRDKIIEIRSKGQQTVIPTSIHPSGSEVWWVDPTSGKTLPPFSMNPGPPGKITIESLISHIDEIAAVAAMASVWINSSRHDLALALAGGLVRSGKSLDEAIEFVQRICQVTNDEDELNNQERTLAVQDTYKKWANGGRKLQGWPALEGMIEGNGRNIVSAVRNWLHIGSSIRLDSLFPKLTDGGNADRFATLYNSELRYNDDTGLWLAWEGTRWRTGRTSTAMNLARAVSTEIMKDAVELPNERDREDMWRFGRDSDNAHRLRAMVSIAQTLPELITYSDDLDSDPADINFLNYTYNLETMSHRNHRQEDMITKLSPINYNPLAKKLKIWEDFLDYVTNGDSEFRRYLQKAAGLSMSGYMEEEVLFIAHGPAATGKTTFLETLRSVLGDYSTATSPEVFLAGLKANAGAARPDLVKLMGARFVTAVEIDEGRHLAHSVVKMITGGDTMAARPLYKAEIEFKPICKIWIATNNDPGIRANDSGMWRRVHILNFHNVVPEEQRDKHLKAQLADWKESGPAIVNWLIEGYRLYKEEGLKKPEVVRKATEDYRQQEDFMFDFFAVNCEFGPITDVRYRARGQDMMERYNEWARKSGNPSLATNVLAQRFKDRGLVPRRSENGRIWHGVRLRDNAEVFGMNTKILLDAPEGEDAVVA